MVKLTNGFNFILTSLSNCVKITIKNIKKKSFFLKKKKNKTQTNKLLTLYYFKRVFKLT